ncbi:MAG: PCRF domain-containing protein, partial [Oscillospiraceae bacterium]|nr:PCRF domain-containing protein [Oscillospiraceae bacterium]
MLQFDEQRLKLNELKPELDGLRSALGIDALKKKLAELDEKIADPDFWNDTENNQAVLQESKRIKDKISGYEELAAFFTEIADLIDIAEEMGDASVLEEVTSGVSNIETRLAAQKLATLLTGEYDANNAILTFHAGAGG